MVIKPKELALNIQPTMKQNLAWLSLLDNTTKYVVFGGGGGGGKSFMGCEWLIVQSLRYPGIKSFIAREKLKTIKQSTLQTFFKAASHHGLKKDTHYFYHQQDSYIDFPNGSRIDILELKYNPSDPMFEDLGSLEFTFGWIEEAGEIDTRAYDTIKTRIGRWNNDKYQLHPKLLITCNPKKNWLYTEFYKPWRDGTLPKDAVFIQALVDDNPYNESEYKAMLTSIKDPIKRQRLLLGDWEYDSEAGTLMGYDAINDLWSNTVVPEKERYMTIDVARFGVDKTVIYFWEGFRLYRREVYENQDTKITAQKIREFAKSEKISYSRIVIDEDGVGGGVVDNLRGVKGFVNNSTPLVNKKARDKKDEPQNFVNLKTQCTFMMADKVNRHEVQIDIEDEDFRNKLTEELEVIRRKNVDDDEKKLSLISKDDIKQIIGRSPDNADCFIFRMFFELSDNHLSQEDFDQRVKQQQRATAAVVPFDKWAIG